LRAGDVTGISGELLREGETAIRLPSIHVMPPMFR
jgi:hypothetical protein